MYLYFNSKGVLEEVVNDIPTRKDSSNVNHIYVYIDGVAYDTDKKLYPLPSTITALSTKYQLPDGTITPTALVNTKVKSTIPYDKHRDMKCFKDFYTYEFFDIELPSGVNEDGSQSEIPNVLGQSGLVALTIIEQPVGLALGLVVFNVEKEVGITTDTLITEAQFNYLMGYIADYKKKIDESVQANINKVDGLSKVTPANNLALYQLTNLMSTYNGAYARRIKDNIIFANNNVYKFTDTSLNLVQNNVITDSDAIEIANIQPNYFDNFVVLTYRAKLANGNYEIRARISYITDAGSLYRIGDYKTIDTNSSYGLHEPFTLILSNTTAYVIYSRENNLSNQDIVARKITFDTTNNTITAVGEDIIMVSGTNQKDDDGEVIDNSRPGFAIVDKLIDGSYLMVFESNINNDRTDYPYVVQYMYFKDIENSKTYTTPQTLFKVKFANVNIPYLAVKNDGRVVMTYHSTGNYYGANGDNLGIHKKVFEAVESNRVITYGTELTRNDFVNIPLYDNKENQWSGAWGSTFIYNDEPYFMYVIGTNTETSSTQNNFVVANIELIPEKSVNATPNTIMLRDNNGASYVQTPSNPSSTNIINFGYLVSYITNYIDQISSVEVTNNSLVKRSSRGFIYSATPTNLDPTENPTLVVTKAFVAAYVNSKLVAVLVYKGSVQTYANLPTNADIGDVYNVIEAYQSYPAGTNFAWNGKQWDALGGSIDLSGYATIEYVDNESDRLQNLIQDNHDDITKLNERVSEQETEIEGVKLYAQSTQEEVNELKASLYGYVFGEDTASFDKIDISALPRIINGFNVADNTRLALNNITGRAVKWTQLVYLALFKNTQTISGVTFTFNKNNGTITVNGTATEDISFSIMNRDDALNSLWTPADYVCMKGCPTGGSESTYYLLWGNTVMKDTGNGIYAKPSAYSSQIKDTTNIYTGLQIIIKSGITVTNKVFKPQVFNVSNIYGLGKEPATITDFNKDYPCSIYPYGKQSILTTKVSGIKISAGYKNLIDKNNLIDTSTEKGVTFTVDKINGTVTVNGTATANIYHYIYNNAVPSKSQNTNNIMLLQGCPSGGSSSTYQLYTALNNNYPYEDIDNIYDTGRGAIRRQGSFNNYYNILIFIGAGTVCNNLVFKPYFINLTNLYGPGNEPTTVAQFNQDFPDIDNIPYPEQTISFPEQELYGINDIQDTLQVVKQDSTYEVQLTKNIYLLDLGSIEWETWDAGGTGAYNTVLNIDLPVKAGFDESILPNMITSKYVSVTRISMEQTPYNLCITQSKNGYIFIRNTSMTSASDLRTSLNGQILYGTARNPTTTTIATLTPSQVTAMFTKDYCVEILGNDDNKIIVRPNLKLDMVVKLIGGNTNE